jgi:hypothetical protein
MEKGLWADHAMGPKGLIWMPEKLVKIRFELDPSDWHGCGVETLWAEPIAEGECRIFDLRNSPFYAMGVNNLDRVRGKATEGYLVYDFVEVIERGGHSTYMLLMQPGDARINAFWNRLEGMGCTYESTTRDFGSGRQLLYSVDVPPTSDVDEVYEVFEEGLKEGVWDFQEGYAYIPESHRDIQES